MQHRAVEILQEIVPIFSVNPFYAAEEEGQSTSGEAELADYIEAFGRQLGLKVTRQNVLPGRDNVFVECRAESAASTRARQNFAARSAYGYRGIWQRDRSAESAHRKRKDARARRLRHQSDAGGNAVRAGMRGAKFGGAPVRFGFAGRHRRRIYAARRARVQPRFTIQN